MTLANALESYEAQVRLLARWLRQGGSLGACENIYARYVAVFFSSSRRPSVPNHVWWKFLLRCMCMYRRAHTRIMFRCWILHLPLCLLWQPQYPCFCTFPLLGFGLFHFTSNKERGCYTPAGTFVVGYSQITGGMSYQLMPGGPLMPGFTLGLHDLCTFRKG